MACIITNKFSAIFSFYSPFFIIVTCFHFNFYCFQLFSSILLLSCWACKPGNFSLLVTFFAFLRLILVICNVVQLAGLLIFILLCLLIWWSLLSYFFLRFSEVCFSRLFVLSWGLHLVIFVWLLLPVLFVLLWTCKVAIWRYCFYLIAWVVLKLALGSFCLVVAFCSLCVVIGL